MIKIPLEEYYNNKDKYTKYRNIKVYLKGTDLSFKGTHLPDEPKEIEGKLCVVPTYIKSTFSLEHFLKTFGLPEVSRYMVHIDDFTMDIINNQNLKLSRDNLINLDEYVIKESMHWFNQEVIRFYKARFKDSWIYTVDRKKTKDIFKKLTSSVPINYKDLLKLFSYTAVSDEAFRLFMQRRKEK